MSIPGVKWLVVIWWPSGRFWGLVSGGGLRTLQRRLSVPLPWAWSSSAGHLDGLDSGHLAGRLGL